MADEKESSSATVVLAFLSGAAIGAIAALLLAPQSGEETQRQLRGYARKAGRDLRGATGKAGEMFDEVIEKGREFLNDQPVLSDALEAGRKAIHRARGAGKKRK